MNAAAEKRLAQYLKAKAREEARENHPGRPIAATGVIPWLWRGGRMPWPKPFEEDVCAVVGMTREYQSTLHPELWSTHVGICPEEIKLTPSPAIHILNRLKTAA